MTIQNEKKYPPYLVKDAIKYCESIGAMEIYNIADLGSNEYRVMYYIEEDKVKRMRAQILKIPQE